MHTAEYAVAPALQGRMHVPGDPLLSGHQPKKIVGEVHRLYRTQPQPFDSGFREQEPDESGQPHRATRFAAPSSEIDPAEHHFAISPGKAAHLLQYLFDGCAAAASANKRNNAERAPVVAPVLNLEIGPRAISRGILHGR